MIGKCDLVKRCLFDSGCVPNLDFCSENRDRSALEAERTPASRTGGRPPSCGLLRLLSRMHLEVFDKLVARVHVELAVHVPDVGFCGSLRNDEGFLDIPDGFSLGKQAQHLFFPL